MKVTFLAVSCLVVLLTVAKCDTNCEEKEKSLISLDVAEDLISKAKELFPNCTDVFTTNTSECSEKEKASAYLDLAKKLIKEAKENYPTCIEHPIEDPATEFPVTATTVTEKPTTENPIEYPKSRDCYEVLQKGYNKTGIYTIWPDSSSFPNRSLEVRCDMDTDGGGWTVIQRRGKFTPQEDFYRKWQDYKEGFGNLTKDFWLGNDNIFILSNQDKYKIRFDLASNTGERGYAVYNTFRIEGENSKYKLHIGTFSGNVGNSMAYHDGLNFYTRDRDNEKLCAGGQGKAGWWYNNCAYSNLNGKYNPGAINGDYSFMYWYYWKTQFVGLSASEMKIKPLYVA